MSAGTTTYNSYDGNGNTRYDGRNGATIYYNMLNLPDSIPAKHITYTYDATGKKLRRNVNGTITQYVDGIQYTGTSIDFMQTEEGRVLNLSGTPNYEYSLSDHLGNNRVNIDSNHGGSQVVQSTYYMPFGLEIATTVNGAKNEYLYNKKELQEDIGQYDYGARFYDPVIAQWGVVDPLAEVSRKWSPYNYTMNNPVRNIDPDGMITVDGGYGQPTMVGSNDYWASTDVYKVGGETYGSEEAFLKSGYENAAITLEGLHDSEALYQEVMGESFGKESKGKDIEDFKIHGDLMSISFGDDNKGKNNKKGNKSGILPPSSKNNEDSLWPHAIGPGLIAAGQPWVSKAFILPGSSSRTSVASYVLSKAIPIEASKRLWAPVVRNGSLDFVGTRVVGRVIGRWVPWVGWAWTYTDVTWWAFNENLNSAPNKKAREEMLRGYNFSL